MPFPTDWPPRVVTGRRSIRFYVTGTATANYSDNAYLFIDDTGANTYTPTPYIAPGAEKTVVALAGLPLGTGRNPKDAYFHPNEFQWGAGGNSTFAKSGSTITFTDFNADPLFGADLVGKSIRITGSTSAGNNGTFTITSVPSNYKITWENAAGVAEAFPSSTGKYRIRRIVVAPPKAQIWANTILVRNTGGAALTFSFDGTVDHGSVSPGESQVYRNRHESGIALKGGGTFEVEAW